MECSPFVVCWMGETDWNSITVTSSSHVSSCSPSLLPLVGICDGSIRSGKTGTASLGRLDRTDRTEGCTSSVSITGTSIELRDGDLILGTGPLIGSLDLDRAGNDVETKSVWTSLVGCVFVNMTSRCSSEGIEVGSWFGQSIVGSVVSSCSNHLYGTSIRSLNGGGSLLSLNSSFVSCLVDATNENKPFTTQSNLAADHSLFSFTLCTFKGCSSTTHGGAIYSNNINVDVSIESCSFNSCSAASYGGAIFIYLTAGTTNVITLKSSSYMSCSADRDTSLAMYYPGNLIISECVFIESEAVSYGGAMGLVHWDPAINGGAISNCLFQNCKQTSATSSWGGGSMFLNNCPSVQLSSLLFDECSAATGIGHVVDVYSSLVPTLNSTTVSNCASSSKYSTSLIFVKQTGKDFSELLNQSPPTITLTALTAKVKGTTADVEVALNKEVFGTLLVVVSNVGGERVEVTKGIPNIGRVLRFSMSSSIGSCSVSVGETGLLQTPLSDYSIVAAFLPGHIVSFTTSPIFESPKIPPSLISAVCSLDASHTKVSVDFEGRAFEDGEYEVALHDDSWFVVELKTDPDGKSTGTKDLGLIGSESVWFERGTWIVKEVKSVTDSTMLIDIAHPVSFTIPTVARLSAIEVSELDASTKGKVTLSFSSVELENKKEYTLTLIGQNADGETLTRKMSTTSSGEIGEFDEVLYPFATDPVERAQQMKFGVLYKVTSLQATGRLNSVQVGSVGVQMPVEPVRLTKIEVDDETETSIRLLVTGSGFVPKETYTVEVSGVTTGSGSENAHTRTFTIVASGATSPSSSTLLLSSSSDSTSLQFGQTYTVTKIDNGTDDGVVVGTPSFVTPLLSESPPLPSVSRVTTASVELNSQGILMSIVLTGEHLSSDSAFELTLYDAFTIPVSFSSSTKGKSEVVMLGLDGGLDFGSTYLITDLCTGGLKIIADGISFSTPPKPSELTISVCSDDAGDSSMIRSGADVSTCLRIERAWEIAERLSIANTMLRIVKPASLSTPLLVSSLPFRLTSGNMDQSLLSLSQPSSNTDSEPSLLSITNGECGLAHLTITTSSSSSFKFLSAQSSTITIQMCSIEGSSSTGSNSDGSICGWNTGFLHFVESTTNLSSVTMKGLGSGGIVQKGGELTITKGEFSDNGRTISSFPSARQNIHCEGEGKLMIDSLSKGDGTRESPSAWIDAEECTISGDQFIVSSPLFVPTLDSDNSSTNIEQKTNTIHFSLKGEMLVPCGLDVEVFEWDSEKSVKGASTLLQLDTLATTKWTETEIVGQVDLKTSLSSLNSSLQWRARLVFGDNLTTANSFLFASASSTGKGNMSQGGTSSKMLWIIPVAVAALLAVGFLVMLVCFVRVRRDRKQKSDVLLSHQEMDAQNEADIEKVEIAADLLPNSTGPAHLCSKSIKSEFSDGSAEEMWTLKCDSDQTGEMVDVIELDGKEHTATKVRALTTLHSKLHKENSLLHPQLIQRQVAFGLSQVLSTLQTKDALTQLTSHWVLFDSKDRMFLQISSGSGKGVGVSGESGKKGMNGSNEGLRWGAPEQKEDETLSTNDVDVEKVSVFRFGLLLWEMETGEIPFKEVDAVNAHRQVVSGIRPDILKVTNSSMRALIQNCLHQAPEHRPTLTTVERDLGDLSTHFTKPVDHPAPDPFHN
ncbi:hypothetical protein BLNAU_21144 [Blattamonas nauphoetae]|uniref:Protein kinase domain-containing protein n=1 Tax=Blattamonas nauphoetae TaxID=2049346 RepID=A0ABQ9WWP5_9EUKA|nr:hypothetical protein BLNAU_21144 [Blattamonas nauphoetae]